MKVFPVRYHNGKRINRNRVRGEFKGPERKGMILFMSFADLHFYFLLFFSFNSYPSFTVFI
jgi:hypothetical protein